MLLVLSVDGGKKTINKYIGDFGDFGDFVIDACGAGQVTRVSPYSM